MATITISDGETDSYPCYSDGTLATVSGPDGYSVTYDTAGRLTTRTATDADGNVYTVTYTYHADGNLLTRVWTDSDGAAYWTVTYTYDADGNMTATAQDGTWSTVTFNYGAC